MEIELGPYFSNYPTRGIYMAPVTRFIFRSAEIVALAMTMLSLPANASPLIGYEKGSSGTFWSVDLTSGTRTLLGSGSGLGGFQDFEYAPNGMLVGYEKGSIGTFWSVDLTSGTRSLLGSGSGLGGFQDFEFAPNGMLVGYEKGSSGTFWSVDPSTLTKPDPFSLTGTDPGDAQESVICAMPAVIE